jgi:glycosyltransferase involved in cell wall biosynthesis
MPDCLLVPPRDPNALADALIAVLSRLERSVMTRDRRLALIKERYSVTATVDQYERLYRASLSARGFAAADLGGIAHSQKPL